MCSSRGADNRSRCIYKPLGRKKKKKKERKDGTHHGAVCCYETRTKGGRDRREEREKRRKRWTWARDKRGRSGGCDGWVQSGKKEGWKDGGMEGWRDGDGGWWRESDNRNVFSHRFTQAIALPFSPALINGIIEQCGIPLKILLRFHKKSNCVR